MPTKDEIAAKVRDIFKDTLKIEAERLEGAAHLRNDLELDSLDMIEVVYELEDEFDVQIPEDRVQTISTFNEIVEGLEAALLAKA